MRSDIDRRSRRLKDVLSDEAIRKDFLKGVPKNDARIVKAFVAANAGNALKTRPKGYDANHPDIDLLRLKNFTIGASLTEEELLGPGDAGFQRVSELLGSLKPFITYLNSVVMPDEAESESEEEDDDDDKEGEGDSAESSEAGDDDEAE